METAFRTNQKKDAGTELIHDEFLELAVHDLDSPLRKLVLLTDRLDEKANELMVPNELHPYLARIRNCANGMRSLVDDLEMLTNIRLQETNFASVNLDDILRESLREIQEKLIESKAIVDVSDLPAIKGDSRLLTILFKNLIINSIKFCEKESVPRIQIKSTIVSEDERKLFQLPAEGIFHRIEIRDNGIGFKQEDARKILQPFVSLHGRLTPGNGMGLAIANRIVTIHGGMLFAEGKEGEGATFTFIIPQTP